MKTVLVLVIGFGIFPVVMAQDEVKCDLLEGATLSPLNWMAGHWREDKGKVSEEWWVPAKGGLMLGLHRDSRPGKKAFFEYLRIEQGEKIAYIASPLGRGTTTFFLSACGPNWVTFENPKHDWPTIISYRLEGDTLVAQAKGGSGDNKREATWRLTRVQSSQ